MTARNSEPAPLDPDLAAILQVHAAAAATTSASDPVAALRQNHQLQLDIGSPERILPKPTVEERTVGGVPIRIYRPDAVTPLATVVHLHGGGWMSGDLRTSDPLARVIATELPAVVVTVDYRRIPEHPWPAPLADADTVITWVSENIRLLGRDPRRVALIGDSAGAHLCALAARTHDVALQVLLYPTTALTVDRDRFPSQAAHSTDTFLTTEALTHLYRTVFPSDADRSEASLLGAASRIPTIVATAEIDPLASEGQAYADELDVAGTLVDCFTGPRLCHGYADFLVIPAVQRELDLILRSMRHYLSLR